MKKLMIVAILAMCLTTAQAKTDIFDGRNFSIYFGDENVVLEGGFTPLKRLDWGLRYMADFADTKTDHLQIQDHYIGLWIKYPFMEFEGLFPKLPIEGQAFAGAAILNELKTDNFDFIPEIGVDIGITDEIDGRLSVQYSKRSELFETDWQFMAGMVARW